MDIISSQDMVKREFSNNKAGSVMRHRKHTCILTHLHTCTLVYLYICILSYIHTYIIPNLQTCLVERAFQFIEVQLWEAKFRNNSATGSFKAISPPHIHNTIIWSTHKTLACSHDLLTRPLLYLQHFILVC